MTEEEVRAANQAPISDEEALGALRYAARVVESVNEMIAHAISAVDHEDADYIHAQRMKTGARGDEKKDALRAHPLYPLWKLASKTADQLARLLSVTNPQLFARSKAVILDARRRAKPAAA